MPVLHRKERVALQAQRGGGIAAPADSPASSAASSPASMETAAPAATDVPVFHENGHGPSYRDVRDPEEMEYFWGERSRIVLTPVAAPSILGLYGFMGATVMVAAWMAGWYGTTVTPFTLWPFALAFGGIAQFLAAMWCYRARDGLGTAMHGLWGTFWIGFGILTLLAETGVAPALVLAKNPAFAWWFIVLASITMMGALAAMGENLGIFTVLGLLAAGSAFAAIGFYGGGAWAFTVAGYVLVASAAAAWYTASAMMLEGSLGRTILPLGTMRRGANMPGGRATRPIEYAFGMPGARAGQ